MGIARAIPKSTVTISEAPRDAILRQLALGQNRPTELLLTLGEEFTDFELKESMLRLLHEGAVIMASDWRLRLGSPSFGR